MEWMAWTPVTAAFFAAIALLLAGMGIWEVRSPSVARRGVLPMTTTRGDRLFVGLLAAAFLHLAWIGLTDLPLWIALGLALALAVAILRWA